MLIREQDRDLHSVWSGPLCRVYTEFFITGQWRKKRKVFIALIISLSDSYRTRGDGENRSRGERGGTGSGLKKWKRGSLLSCICWRKGRGMLEAERFEQISVRPHLKAKRFIPVSNGHTRRQSGKPAVKGRGRMQSNHPSSKTFAVLHSVVQAKVM